MAADKHDLAEGYRAYRELVNPMIAIRAALTGEPWKLARVLADGRLEDASHRIVDDFLSGWGTQALGHRPRDVEAAVVDFLAGDTPSFYTSSISPHAGLLAARLRDRTGYDSITFASGGTEAVEAAIKLARATTGRPRVLGLDGGFHGCTLGSLALMAPGPYRDPFAPHVPAIASVPFGDVTALEAALASGDVAAVIVEAIQVEGGVRALPPAYVSALCELTTRTGTLLIVDEIQTGLGRTGRLLASDGWPRRPDAITLGKALGGGVLPISALLTSRAVFDRAYGSHERSESHVSTFAGNSLACVAALAALERYDAPLLDRVAQLGDRFRAALTAALEPLDLVVAVRGEGLLIGIELAVSDHPWLSFAGLGLPELGERSAVGLMLVHRLARAGFHTGVCGHDWNVLRLQPPLVIAEERLQAFVEACRTEVEYLCRLA